MSLKQFLLLTQEMLWKRQYLDSSIKEEDFVRRIQYVWDETVREVMKLYEGY